MLNNYTFIQSKHRKNVLVDKNGFYYHLKKESKVKTLWFCTERDKKKCEAAASIVKSIDELILSGEHTHDVVHTKTSSIVKNAVQNAAVNPNIAVRTVLGNITESVNRDPDASIHAMKKKESIMRSIRYAKQKAQVKIFYFSYIIFH